MKTLKSARTLAASLGVLAIGAMAATPAMAFDNVDWSWEKNLTSTEDVYVDIKINLESTGLVEVEKLQVFLGNVTATSTVHGIDNIQYDRDQYADSVFYNGYYVVAGWEGLNHVCYVECDIDDLPFDAIYELPSVVSTATAVGNNQSITADVPIFLHDGQFVANSSYNRDGATWMADLAAAMPAGSTGGGGYSGDEGNLHTNLAVLFTLAAGFGVITPAEISAESKVWDIKNATVDSTATAVANNMSVTLESDVAGTTLAQANPVCIPSPGHSCYGQTTTPLLSNHALIADITQFAYANVSAVSEVSYVSLNEYSHLSPDLDPDGELVPNKLGRAIVSSVATAVGNNVSITVGVPAP